AFRFAKELWQAPFIVTFHGYDFSRFPAQHGSDVYRRLFEVADRVTVNCDYVRRRVEALGCPAEKLHRLHMGVDPKSLPFAERVLGAGEPVRLLTVARLVEKKGVEYAVRAVAKVRETYPDVRYDIIGDGPLRPRIERLIDERGLERVVTLHGA